MFPMELFLAATPSDVVAGLPGWVPDVLSVGGLITLIVGGLASSKLWTKAQVDWIKEELTKSHDREIANLKERYDTHLSRTVELYKGRVEDAVRREGEWRETAQTWQGVAEKLTDGIEPMQEQSATTLAVLQSLQMGARQNRPGRRT